MPGKYIGEESVIALTSTKIMLKFRLFIGALAFFNFHVLFKGLCIFVGCFKSTKGT
jgi:hypothetical protein